MTDCNYAYQRLIKSVMESGDFIPSRNGDTLSLIDAMPMIFHKTPLVTIRATAWRMALREMEWFMSGQPQCPDALLTWWAGQLNPKDAYLDGYSEQFRAYNGSFDQICHLLNGLRTHPNSRRLVMTTWHSEEMAFITDTNKNPSTPTCCHSSLVQLFVRDQTLLHMSSYQRSADILLGLPHNFIQTWALLLYFAHHANLQVGTLRWILGDAHLYQHPTHRQAAREIVHAVPFDVDVELCYQFSGQHDELGVPVFLASDFSMSGEIPTPIVTTRPMLLI